MTQSNLVSVIIPAFNARHTIARAIESAISQTHRPLEIVVVDDGSDDDTADVVQAYSDHVRLFIQKNKGASTARNRGVAESKGSYLAFLDADDEWHHRKIELQFGQLVRHPNAAFCTTALLKDSGRRELQFDPRSPLSDFRVSEIRDFAEVFKNPYFGTPTILMRRSVFESCDGFNEQLESAEDLDLWLRAAFGRTVVKLEAVLVRVSRTATGLSARRGYEADYDNLRVVERFVEAHPEFAHANKSTVNAVRADILTRLGSSMLNGRDPERARPTLLRALRHQWFAPRALYLFAKSFFVHSNQI